MEHPLLEVKNLTVSFKKDDTFHSALHGINFTLRNGETLGIVGESGSGKSVTCMSILGLLPSDVSIIDSGSAIYSNGEYQVDLIAERDQLEALRGKGIGMIFQEPMTSLNPLFTCGNQMLEAAQVGLGITGREAKSRILEWFEKVELPNPSRIFSSFPHELSGGQRQRVMIAMAMISEPDLLIADEPTTALDVTVQKSVIDLIYKLKEEHNTAVIFISHDLGVIKNIADKVLVMRKGEVVEVGAAQNLFATPKEPYTKGLIACKPEQTDKKYKLLTVEQIEAEHAVNELRKDVQTLEKKPLYEVKNLSKHFVKKGSIFSRKSDVVKAVNDVSFTIHRGETVGLVGESGCGKSTLSKLLTGLLIPDEGKMMYDGKDTSQFSASDWRRFRNKIQFIFQDPFSALNPRKTVQSALIEVVNKFRSELSSTERSDKVKKLVSDVGLPEESLGKFPHQFSGGQRQRVVIARALAANPEFIIADESVSALDVSVQAQVLNLLNDLKAEYNLTYLFISHDLAVVNYMSDSLLVMKSGKIVESGSAAKVYTKPSHEYTQHLLNSVYN